MTEIYYRAASGLQSKVERMTISWQGLELITTEGKRVLVPFAGPEE